MNKLNTPTKLYHDNLMNLSVAIQKAGGYVGIITTDMTVGELLDSCAKNGISLSAKFQPPEKEEKKYTYDAFGL